MTRRLRGDTRSCLQWSAPCAASLESSTASLVSDDVVRAVLKMFLKKMYPKNSHALHGITKECDFTKSLKLLFTVFPCDLRVWCLGDMFLFLSFPAEKS